MMKPLILAVAALLSGPAVAQEKSGVGYGGAYVQLKPIMAPVIGPRGVMQYEAVTIRLILDVGEKERGGCFSAPMVHEKIVLHLYKNPLTMADLVGQRRDVLAKSLLAVAIAATDKGYYSDVKIIDPAQLELEAKKATEKGKGAATPAEQLENKSKTLTSQCR
jgi:hypothetical protein